MIAFDNVTLLSYSHSPSFFGFGLRYKVQKTFSIEGVLVDLSNTDGLTGTWTKAELLNLSAKDYEDIIINGKSFGKGKVRSISFAAGNHVQQQKYSLNIEAYSTGDLSLSLPPEYDGLDFSTIACVDSFNDSLSFTRDESKDQAYQHSLNIRFNRNIASLTQNPTDLAKALAINFFSNTNLSSFIGDFDGLVVNKYHTETYNAVDFSCSISETWKIPNASAGDYSISFFHTLTLSEKGIVSASEKGSITALATPRQASAALGFATEATDALVYGRVNSIYANYNWSILPLHEIVISSEVSDNKFEGKIEYTKTFTNDPKVFEYAIWDKTLSFSRSEQNYITVSERGSVRGIGRPLVNKFERAKDFYNSSVLSGIAARALAFYNYCGGTNAASLVVDKVGYSEAKYAGAIDYERSWTDNRQYIMAADIKKQEVSVSTEYPVHLTSVFNIFNEKQLIQPQNTSTVGNRSIEIKLQGARSTTLAQYVAAAKAIIVANSYHLIGTDPIISSANYSLQKNRNRFSMSVRLSFFGFYRAFERLSLS
jgi:hypothetical protein